MGNLKRVALAGLLIASAAVMLTASKDRPELAPGIDEVRPGIKAYTDLWHLCFWNKDIEAGMKSSHNEDDLNIDLGNFHGTYKGAPILAKIENPGVVYRIWSAAPTGKLYFWADGKSDPAMVVDFKDYLEGKDGSEKDFAVGRYTNYTPFAFQKELIVTAVGFLLHGAYYQVSYMEFKNGHGLETTRPEGNPAYDEYLRQAKTFWASNGRDPGRDPGGIPRLKTETVSLGPGQSGGIEIGGTGMVTDFILFEESDKLDPLENVNLEITFDRARAPQVTSPVDAFFGNRFDARTQSHYGKKSKDYNYETMALSATIDGYSCRWPMPFKKGMSLRLINNSDESKKIKVSLAYREFASLPDNAMRFHALYQERDYPDDMDEDDVYGLMYKVDQDDNYVALDRKGRGYYAGIFLYVIAVKKGWWGEGDEMIWVDGREKAKIRGTGTEDEFNWSYGFKENRSPISGALIAYRYKPDKTDYRDPHNVLYRYRQGDFVPFHQSIKVTFERLGNTSDFIKRYPGSAVNVSPNRGEDYRSVVYWYELPNSR